MTQRQSLFQCRSERRILCAVTIYDQNVLQQYADALYRQAKWIAFWTAVRYGLVVFLLSLLLGIVVGSQKQVSADTANAGVILIPILTLLGNRRWD